LLAIISLGCHQKQASVVVYTALDRNFSEPIFEKFTQETGIKVLPKYDTESTKTVGLVNAIISEANQPRCDVFWNNEIVNTIRLKNKDLLQPCQPKNADLYPSTFKDADGTWYGFAGRARVLIVNTNLVPEGETPTSVQDLAKPDFKDVAGIAKPLFGTTASHAACLFALLGDEQAKAYLMNLKNNGISIESGNKTCALDVSAGKLAAGLTDTDDAIIEINNGKPVKLVFPDQEPDQPGTLFIPNTVAMIAKAPHPEEAQILINYLLSPEVEEYLSQCPSAQIPLNKTYKGPHPLGELPEHHMDVDFNEAAANFKKAGEWIKQSFL
jgi:iron(III) transport system substrate-binding protein